MDEGLPGNRSAAFWSEVRAEYSAGRLTLRKIYEKFDLTAGEFAYARQQLGWVRRKQAPFARKTLLRRLFKLVDRMIAKLEDDMKTAGEREVGVLSRLVNTMGKLIAIEEASNTTPTPRQTREMLDIRDKLVERIAELKRE